jgi:hypothetical protein
MDVKESAQIEVTSSVDLDSSEAAIVKRHLSGASGKLPDARDDRDPRLTFGPMSATAAPDEWMAVLVPVRRRRRDRRANLLPGLE